MNTTAVEVVLSLGSNCGDRKAHVTGGIQWLSKILSNFRVSPIYATPDCLGSQKEYMNAVAAGETSLSQEEIDNLCKEYEISCGRDAESRKSNLVPIDIDLVIYGSDILRPRDFARDFFQIGFRSLSSKS